jgi:hypothetical protein
LNKILEVPKGEHDAYIRFINQPGLRIPAGMTSVEFYLLSTKRGQQKLEVFE